MRKCLVAGLLAAVAIPGSALAACPFSYVFNYVSSPQPISIVTGAVGAGNDADWLGRGDIVEHIAERTGRQRRARYGDGSQQSGEQAFPHR